VKAAMDYSDAVTTVSPTYAKELMKPAFAHGLAEIVYWNSNKLTGIINGIDYESYNPETDGALFVKYNAAGFEKQAENKVQLQRMLGLAEGKDIPLVGMVTRLVQHKGMDILKQAVHDILKQNVQLVLLGKGDVDYESYFTYIERNYENKFKAVIAFNRDLSRKFYGGADIFLMPSKTEPCGLAQMIACRYGTVPVVHETGGLFDTVKDCGGGGDGNGFTFARYDAEDLTNAVTRAVSLYNDNRAGFTALAKRIMSIDFSWGNSAAAYAEFYNGLIGRE
jgi:starch synthase